MFSVEKAVKKKEGNSILQSKLLKHSVLPLSFSSFYIIVAAILPEKNHLKDI